MPLGSDFEAWALASPTRKGVLRSIRIDGVAALPNAGPLGLPDQHDHAGWWLWLFRRDVRLEAKIDQP
jgi:hypothetical protein